MSEKKRELLHKIFGGFLVGTVNGLFGAGGGMVAVPMLKKLGIRGKEAHSSSVAVILPISVFSLVIYLLGGRVQLSAGLPYIFPGLIGALIGTAVLAKIPEKWLRRIFALFMIYAGVRLVFR